MRVQVAGEARVAVHEGLVARRRARLGVQGPQVLVQEPPEGRELRAELRRARVQRRRRDAAGHVEVAQGHAPEAFGVRVGHGRRAVARREQESDEVGDARAQARRVEDDADAAVEVVRRRVADRARVQGPRAPQQSHDVAQHRRGRAAQLRQEVAVGRRQEFVARRRHRLRRDGRRGEAQVAARLEEHGVEQAPERPARELVDAVLGREEREDQRQADVGHREVAQQQLRVALAQRGHVVGPGVLEARERRAVQDVVLRDVAPLLRRQPGPQVGAGVRARRVAVPRRVVLGDLAPRDGVERVRVRPAPEARAAHGHGVAALLRGPAPGELRAEAVAAAHGPRVARAPLPAAAAAGPAPLRRRRRVVGGHVVGKGRAVRVEEELPEEVEVAVRRDLGKVLHDVRRAGQRVAELEVRVRRRQGQLAAEVPQQRHRRPARP